jgi:GT2 family glycosyltransferase
VSPPTVSVVVPTIDRVDLLARTLDGLAAQEMRDFEAVIVHDGDPGVVALLAARAGDLPLRSLQIADRGATPKRNAGWQSSRAEFIAFTDDDCEPTAGWLAGVVPALANPKVDVVQGPTHPHPADADVEGLFKRTIEVRHHTETYPCANVTYRRSALERVGGFDPALWGGGEDTDLAWRVRESGGLVAFSPDALVYHAVRPAGLADHLRSLPRWQTLALVVRRHPRLRSRITNRVFWKASHRIALLALLALLIGVVTRDPRTLVLVAPLLVRRVREAGLRAGLQLALSDLVEVGVVLVGSARYRTLLL